MASALDEQIATLEREKSRLENLLAPDSTWQAYRALDDIADRQEKSRLAITLSSNPYFVARNKIIQAIALLDQSGLAPGHAARRPSIAEMIEPLDAARSTVPEQSPATAPSAPELVNPSPVDSELTRIRGIDSALAARLADLGVTRCAEVEAWTAADVSRFASALGLGKSISRQNWIEQAAIHAAKLPRIARLADPLTVPEQALDGSPPLSIAPECATSVTQSAAPAPIFPTFSRPPLFDFTPERIMPPFVAHTNLAQTPPHQVVMDAPAPPVVSPSLSEQRPRRASSAPAVADIPRLGGTDAIGTTDNFYFTEADVVIVGRNSVSQAPPPIPADPGRIRSLSRRLLGEKKPRDVDTTPYAPERGAAEEASVEIVRSNSSHMTPPGRSTPRSR